MAAEQTAIPTNGTYANQPTQYHSTGEPHLSSHAAPHTATATTSHPGSFGSQGANVPAPSTGGSSGNGTQTDVPKDEVGWFFVEQYYTNLSRSPDRLHLFYSKKSQFVWGVEAEKVSVAVGRNAIQERIAAFDFKDCKVRVSNVDSQASYGNIVIQVIGEMSNNSAPHRKFVQTFVLAEQPNGYFVLNDIFRYINDEEEEEVEDIDEGEYHEETFVEPEPKDVPATENKVEQPLEVEEVHQEVEQQDHEEPVAVPEAKAEDEDFVKVDAPVQETNDPPSTNGTAIPKTPEAVVSEDTSAQAATSAEEESTEVEEPTAAVEAVAPEKPKTPEPSTAVAIPVPVQQPTATPKPAAAKPSAPKTWANLVAASNPAAPVVPPSTSSTPPAPVQPRVAPPPPQPKEASSPSPQQTSPGWQTAGTDHAKRQARPQSISAAGDKDTVLAYVKNVSDKVPTEVLRSTLAKYGDLAYFDVSRPKNCAFVEFATTAGYNAAVAANPHQIGGENVLVEERRPRSGAYGGPAYNGRGGPGRGRGGPDGRQMGQGRGGFQKREDGGRGGYPPGRGGRGGPGNVTPRGGRGASQPAS